MNLCSYEIAISINVTAKELILRGDVRLRRAVAAACCFSSNRLQAVTAISSWLAVSPLHFDRRDATEGEREGIHSVLPGKTRVSCTNFVDEGEVLRLIT